jgi:ParB family transcriptional regulator, chromosome partitioning protein
MNVTIEIPLNKLVPFAGNVRKTQNKRFIAELAASIRAHGLQQNLVVRKDGKNFAVVAGGQRLKALMQLAKEGDIKSTYRVPCKIADGDFDPSEISLAENVMRDDMHPADRFEAFRDLVDKGQSTADIAARFGTSDKAVQQLLKLARVSPVIMKAYRGDKLTFAQVTAFAVSDDHEAQERLFQSFGPHGREARAIRAVLIESEIATDDKRVKFVTLKAYQKEGGEVRPDWFGKDADSGFILDKGLLDRLLAEKFDSAKKQLAKEGWKWTDAYADFGYQEQAQFRGLRPEFAPLAPALAKEAKKLEAEHEKLEQQWEQAGEEDEYPERLDQITKRLNEIKESRAEVWPQEKLAIAGAVVTIGDEGKTEIMRGLVRPEDIPQESGKKGKAKDGKSGPGDAKGEENQSPPFSAALVESLTAHKSAALAAELAARPDIALAAVVHGFACSVLLEVLAENRSLQIAAQPQSLDRVKGSKAHQQMEAAREKWRGKLPADAEALWTWCLAQKQETLLELLAFCAAATVDAVQGKGGGTKRLSHAKALASALKLDMKPWFTPDAANYFSRVNKPQILDALKEGRNQPPAPAWEKLKKMELAQLAERELAGKGWLPEVLRPAA